MSAPERSLERDLNTFHFRNRVSSETCYKRAVEASGIGGRDCLISAPRRRDAAHFLCCLSLDDRVGQRASNEIGEEHDASKADRNCGCEEMIIDRVGV